MKKRGWAVLAAVVILIGVGWGIKQFLDRDFSPDLSSKEVIRMIEDRYPGRVTQAQLDPEQGQPQYDLKLEATGGIYKIRVDAESGKILEMTQAKEQGPTQEQDTNPNQTQLSRSEVEEIARKQFQGRIKKIDLEREDGRLVYEVVMKSANQEAELEVDAHNGRVLLLSIEEED